eukprot:scaffold138340_cov28-Tisochrysis_lutea.AAC.4
MHAAVKVEWSGSGRLQASGHIEYDAVHVDGKKISVGDAVYLQVPRRRGLSVSAERCLRMACARPGCSGPISR